MGMKRGSAIFVWLLAVCWLLTGCEKAIFDDGEDTTQQQEEKKENVYNVVLTVAGFEELKGKGRATQELTEVCTRLSFVVYQNGTRKKSIHQRQGDADFGRVELTLAAGDYEVLVVGHSSTGKDNPTMTTPEKVQFSNITESGNGTGYSDTFYCLDAMTVGGTQVSRTYTLRRAVAMFRLVTTDVKPSEVKQLWFRYTGGSGALNAYTGYGCVNSTQVVIVDTPSEQDGKALTVDLYTIPRDETGLLTIQARALKANGDIVYERTFTNVPVERNTITQYSGALFTNVPEEPDEPDTPTDPTEPQDPTEPDEPTEPEEPDTPALPSNMFLVETAWATTNYYTF